MQGKRGGITDRRLHLRRLPPFAVTVQVIASPNHSVNDFVSKRAIHTGLLLPNDVPTAESPQRGMCRICVKVEGEVVAVNVVPAREILERTVRWSSLDVPHCLTLFGVANSTCS